MIFSSNENLAWAAGLFEGEGCFSLAVKQRSLSTSVVSTDKDVIERFLTVMRFGSLIGPIPPPKKHPNWKPKWLWKCSNFEEFQQTVILLWPWLQSRRRAKAKRVLQKYLSGVPEITKTRASRNIRIKQLLQKGVAQKEVAVRFGLTSSAITLINHKNRIPKKQLCKAQVAEIRQLFEAGNYNHRELAEMFGCSRSNISLIVNYKRAA